MSEIVPFTVVRLLSGVPECGVLPGALAVVLEVHAEPYEAYEVEAVDESGRTVFAGAVEPAQCVLADEWDSGETEPGGGAQGGCR